MESGVDKQAAETEHIEQNRFGIVHLAAAIQADNGKGGADAGAQAPQMVDIGGHISGKENEDDTRKGGQQGNHGPVFQFFMEETPGDQGHENRIGHVEDIGMGDGSGLNGHVKAVHGNAVGQGAANQQVVFDRAWWMSF